MRPRPALTTLLRVFVVFLCHLVFYACLLKLGTNADVDLLWRQSWRVSGALALMALLNSCLLSYLVLRSRWWGLQLNITLGALFYGVYTVIQRIDTLAFPHVSQTIPQAVPASPMWLDAVFTLFFIPASVVILRGGQPPPFVVRSEPLRSWAVRGLGWKIGVGIVLHELVFLTAGYCIARWPGGTFGDVTVRAAVSELVAAWRQAPWLPGLQVFRAGLWIAVSLPVVLMLRGPAWETSVALGVVWAVASTGQLVSVAPYALDYVARTHQLVFATANFIAGALLGALLLWRGRGSQRLA